MRPPCWRKAQQAPSRPPIGSAFLTRTSTPNLKTNARAAWVASTAHWPFSPRAGKSFAVLGALRATNQPAASRSAAAGVAVPPVAAAAVAAGGGGGGGSLAGFAMDAMAEALAQAEGEQDMEKKIEQALACPCLGEPVGRGLHVLVRPTVQGLNACDSQAQACRRLE